MFLAQSPTPTPFPSFLLTHNKSSDFDFTSHSNATTEALMKKLNPSASFSKLQFSHLERVLAPKFSPFVFPQPFFSDECYLALRISTVIECSGASDFRELAKTQHTLFFYHFFPYHQKECFARLELLQFSPLKTFHPSFSSPFTHCHYILVPSLAYPKEYFVSIMDNSPLIFKADCPACALSRQGSFETSDE